MCQDMLARLKLCLATAPGILLLLTFVALPGLCAPSSHVLKERAVQPRGWEHVKRAQGSGRIQIQISLAPSQPGALEKKLYTISDPTHHTYGQYLSQEDAAALMHPSTASVKLVIHWLRHNGIGQDQVLPSLVPGWIRFDTTIGRAEALLKTTYSEFWHRESNTTVVRCAEWSVPVELRDRIVSIEPTTSFFLAVPQRDGTPRASDATRARSPPPGGDVALNKGATEASLGPQVLEIDPESIPLDTPPARVCNASAVTPLCVRALYGTLPYRAGAGAEQQATPAPGNSMALVNFHGQFNNRSDTQQFLALYRPEAARAGAASSFRDVSVAGGVNQQTRVTAGQERARKGREGNLDAQILLGVGWPVPLVAYTVGPAAGEPPFRADAYTPTNTNEPFLAWLHHVLALPDAGLPRVVALSYGDIEQTVPASYARAVCDGFGQLGLRGVTVIFGAGDSGVGRPGYCRTNNDNNNNNNNTHTFLTSFPAACPYGTSVGATRLTPDISAEIVAYNVNNGFVSGGGSSLHFARPAYQRDAGVVDAYFAANAPSSYERLYAASGRAYPDVAVAGYRRPIVWDGRHFLVDGTSASAPTFAAIIALANDALLAAGRPALGFLNPWLYKFGHRAFTDVVTGSSRGCGTDGFPAKPGWDAASGFGSPRFEEFVALAMESRVRETRPWYWFWF